MQLLGDVRTYGYFAVILYRALSPTELEFSHYAGTEGLNDAVCGRNDIASSIIIDGNSVSSVTPGREMDDNIMNFCLSW